MHGIFNINKPAGITSHDVVSIVRKMSSETRVGHAGTLDPMATGVLLICIGQAVRVSEYLANHDKNYRARIRFGVETDTYDATGTVLDQRDVSVTREQIEHALKSFIGKIEQSAPAFSAIKQKGTPLYKLARRGETVTTQPRAVEIHSIEITDWSSPELEMVVHCGKGTYIRSLAHDLGEKLGCGAHLTALARLASGNFTLENSVTLSQLENAFAISYAEQFLIPLDRALEQFEAIYVDAPEAKKIINGLPVISEQEISTPLARVYSNNKIIALVERANSGRTWKPKKVFVNQSAEKGWE